MGEDDIFESKLEQQPTSYLDARTVLHGLLQVSDVMINHVQRVSLLKSTRA